MAEVEDFSDAFLKSVRISNVLNQENNQEGGEELIKQENKEQMKNFLEKENKCDNYIYVFIIFLIQSAISFGCFYAYYILDFAYKNDNLYFIVIVGMLMILIIFSGFIIFFGSTRFNSKYQKCSNYAFFILINIYKIYFEVITYLIIVHDDDVDQLDFPQFEARVFWKISIFFLYLMLIVYYLFKKEKTSFKFLILLLFSLISLVACFLLLFFTHKSEYNNKRIYEYLIYMSYEILMVLYSFFMEYKFNGILKSFGMKIDWRINRIDFFRYLIILIPSIWFFLKYCRKKCCCNKKKKILVYQ